MFQGSNRSKLIKGIAILLGIILLVAILSLFHKSNSMTLSEYELLNQGLINSITDVINS